MHVSVPHLPSVLHWANPGKDNTALCLKRQHLKLCLLSQQRKLCHCQPAALWDLCRPQLQVSATSAS